MDRRQLAFIILVNAFISLVIALVVVWIVDSRRPDLEELAAQYTPIPPVIMAATVTPVDEAAATTSTLGAETEASDTSVGETVVYIVQAGDILSTIASRYGVPLDVLVETNGLTDPNAIYSGQRLQIPANASAPLANDLETDEISNDGGNPQITALENPGNLEDEAVLIVNESDSPVDLDGWRLEREGGPTYTFDSLPLFAGSSVRVYSSSGEDNSIARYWNETDAIWISGVEAQLVDKEGAVVHSYRVP